MYHLVVFTFKSFVYFDEKHFRYDVPISLLKMVNKLMETPVLPGMTLKIPIENLSGTLHKDVIDLNPCSLETKDSVNVNNEDTEQYWSQLDNRIKESVAKAQAALQSSEHVVQSPESPEGLPYFWKPPDMSFSALAADIIVNFEL